MESNKKKWTIEVCMEEEDFRAVLLKAGGAGLTAGELASAFFNDLVCGHHTNGSDERMYAQQYFERCFYAGGVYFTFSQYLIAHGEMEQFISDYRENLSELDEAMSIRADIAEEKDKEAKAELEEILKDTESYAEQLEADLQAVFERFKKSNPHYEGDFENAVDEALKWYQDMEETMEEREDAGEDE